MSKEVIARLEARVAALEALVGTEVASEWTAHEVTVCFWTQRCTQADIEAVRRAIVKAVDAECGSYRLTYAASPIREHGIG